MWHDPAGAGAYEWWYFDGISRDGRHALVVIFLAGFVFSPRYNRAVSLYSRGIQPAPPRPRDFPAVAVCLYEDGKLLLRAVNEYPPEEFEAGADQPTCRVGRNGFRLQTEGGVARYALELDTMLRRGKRLQASLTWAVEEGDLTRGDGKRSAANDSAAGDAAAGGAATHSWNLVAPRCAVAGELNVVSRGGARSLHLQFDGTGYHDHNHDERWLPATVAEWQWGRAHFDDVTAVFYRYRERGQAGAVSRLYVVRDGALEEIAARFAFEDSRRHHFGLRYPRTLRISGEGWNEGGTKLTIRQSRVVDGSFFYLRFLGEAALETQGGRVLRAPALTEQLEPRALARHSLWWLTGLRIGTNGRGSFLP